MKAFLTQLNESIALRMALMVGTMECFYTFVVMSILPTLFPKQQENILYISNCIQLAFLPLIIVSNNILNRKAEARAEADHAAIMEELELVKRLHADVDVALGLKDASCEVCASVGIG